MVKGLVERAQRTRLHRRLKRTTQRIRELEEELPVLLAQAEATEEDAAHSRAEALLGELTGDEAASASKQSRAHSHALRRAQEELVAARAQVEDDLAALGRLGQG